MKKKMNANANCTDLVELAHMVSTQGWKSTLTQGTALTESALHVSQHSREQTNLRKRHTVAEVAKVLATNVNNAQVITIHVPVQQLH